MLISKGASSMEKNNGEMTRSNIFDKKDGEMTRSNIFDKKDGSGNSYETKRASTSAEPKVSKPPQLPIIEPLTFPSQRTTHPTTPSKPTTPTTPKMASEPPQASKAQAQKEKQESSMPPKPPVKPPLTTAECQTKHNSEINIDRVIVRVLAVASSFALIVIGMASCSATIFGC
jgi:hypothetical protein